MFRGFVRTAHDAWHRCAQNVDHLAHSHPFSPDFAEVVCTLGTTQPQTVISPPPNGGNGVIRTTTRRRHAASQPLMLQNPHRYWRGGHRATSAPKAPPVRRVPERSEGRAARHAGRGARGWRGLAGQRAEAPGEARGADGSRCRRPKRAALTPPPAKSRMQFPRNTNRHKLKNRRISTIRTQTSTCAHGNCMRN